MANTNNIKTAIMVLPVELQRIINDYARDETNNELVRVIRAIGKRRKITKKFKFKFNILKPLTMNNVYYKMFNEYMRYCLVQHTPRLYELNEYIDYHREKNGYEIRDIELYAKEWNEPQKYIKYDIKYNKFDKGALWQYLHKESIRGIYDE